MIPLDTVFPCYNQDTGYFVYSQLWLSAPGLGDFINRYQDRYQYHNLPKEAVLEAVEEFGTRLQLQFCRTNSNIIMQSQSRDV